MTIDEKLLQNLLGFGDEVGVLSFYVGFTPDQAADPQPRAPIEMRNRIKDLRARIKEEESREHAAAIASRLDELEKSDLEGLLDPKAHGRGRAMFVAVSDGRSEHVSLQMPFAERIIFADTPYVRPLVAAYDEGRPAGLLIAHQRDARLLEWAVGEAEELLTRELELTDAQLADIKSGPTPDNPRMSGSGRVDRGAFEARIDENRNRFLSGFVDEVDEIARDRGWDRIVIAGTPKVRDVVHASYPSNNGRRVLLADFNWEQTPAHQVADEAWHTLRSVHRQRELELVDAAKDRALSGGAGALGLEDTLDALNQGRVEHLLYQTNLEVEGYRSSEGTLHVSPDGPEAEAGFEMRREPLLVERMIERVMETSGKVTPVDEEAAGALGEYGGVGALLRW